ncbi:hypothetical protein AHiyo1_14720 [Arthrobacter sp. Hiyo1]|nr:hypothetical protein AHiyo1_14720 [Arthrobacter sp. Hiyo1]
MRVPCHQGGFPDINLDVAIQRRNVPQQAVLSNSFGFGGQNVSLVITDALHPKAPNTR